MNLKRIESNIKDNVQAVQFETHLNLFTFYIDNLFSFNHNNVFLIQALLYFYHIRLNHQL